jgi:hypothetical protein
MQRRQVARHATERAVQDEQRSVLERHADAKAAASNTPTTEAAMNSAKFVAEAFALTLLTIALSTIVCGFLFYFYDRLTIRDGVKLSVDAERRRAKR